MVIYMFWLNVAELLLLLGGVSTCLGVMCYNMRHSRCERISICCGAFKCERKIMTLEEQKADTEPEPVSTDI
jgi:hypothetical protein